VAHPGFDQLTFLSSPVAAHPVLPVTAITVTSSTDGPSFPSTADAVIPATACRPGFLAAAACASAELIPVPPPVAAPDPADPRRTISA
jgi:hypothetical protein